MIGRFSKTICAAALALVAAGAWAQEPSGEASILDALPHVSGPKEAAIGDVANVDLPDGYHLFAAKETQQLLELMGNPTNGKELALIAKSDFDWFVVYEYDPVGYVKDDEKDNLDAGAMLESIKAGTEYANEERKKNGWATMDIVGWHTAPKYDAGSNNLEWAILATSEGEKILNYNTRLLGRRGVMEASLVCGPEQLDAVLPAFRGLLNAYSYKDGERYADYSSGDKVAQYGLAALVTGGAAAAAAKGGLFKGLFKVIAKLGVFIAVGVGAVFNKLRGRSA